MKTRFSFILDNNVAARQTNNQNSAVVPNGKTVIIHSFGGCIPVGDLDGSLIALQYGSDASGWKTIRAFCREADFDMHRSFDRSFDGDGTKMFRLVRKNNSDSPKLMVAWFEAALVRG